MIESQQTICTWADSTFGHASDASIAARALVEMAELVTACVNDEPAERIGEEIADVVIALARLGRSLGLDVMWHVLFSVDDDPGEPATASAVEQIGRLMVRLECGDGLGARPSDEAQVAVEVRAAEIAAVVDLGSFVVDGAASRVCSAGEFAGWTSRSLDVYPNRAPDDESGYLAHAIAHHDDEQAAGQALSDGGTTE